MMIRIIKIVHTIIWLVMASATFYILYAGFTHTFNRTLFIAIALLVTETMVLVWNNWTCPLTPLAGKYTHDRNDNFDIYLPLWLAKYNKMIFGTLFAIGIVLVVINYVRSA